MAHATTSSQRGEMHWTKVLQANLGPLQNKSHLDGSPVNVSTTSRGQQLSISRKMSRKMKETKRKLSGGSSNGSIHQANKTTWSKSGSFFSRLYSKIFRWISAPRRKSDRDTDHLLANQNEDTVNCDSCSRQTYQDNTHELQKCSSTSGWYDSWLSVEGYSEGVGIDYITDSGFASPACLTGDSTPCTESDVFLPVSHSAVTDLAARTYSWPTTSRNRLSSDDDGFIDYEDAISDYETSDLREQFTDNEENFKSESHCDYFIPFCDVQLNYCVKRAPKHHILRGNWHGDVVIHQFVEGSTQETRSFWENLNWLSKIRHENIVLFMGACVEPPNFAIVTSGHKGISLYEHIHLKSEFMPMLSKVNIIQQITRGLGYLHAKGVVMGALNSRNIILDTKVKLSLLDTSIADIKYHKPNFAIIPRGLLTYIPAEQLKALTVEPPFLQTNTPSEPEEDLFAFGTTVYEILSGLYPFCGQTAELIIYRVAKGHSQSLSALKCSSRLKSVIKRCWSHNKHNRPNCTELNQILSQNVALHKKHSTSEPDRIDELTRGHIS